MTVPYVEINLSFLSNFNPDLRPNLFEKLQNWEKHETMSIKYSNIEEFLDKSDRSFFFMLCPYCNLTALFSTSKKMFQLHGEPLVCPFCGETNQYDKITRSIEKSKTLCQLAVYIDSGDGDIDDENIKRTLLEQSIVTIATGLEVFLRDIYSTTLNIKYIKQNKSLIHRFYRDARNEFLNIGKAEKKYIDDLGVNFKDVVGAEILKKLNLLMLKRNVIVHNSGIVDNMFLEQSGLKCKKKDFVPIEIKEIEEYLSIVNKFVEKMGQLFQKEFETEILQRMEQFLQE